MREESVALLRLHHYESKLSGAWSYLVCFAIIAILGTISVKDMMRIKREKEKGAQPILLSVSREAVLSGEKELLGNSGTVWTLVEFGDYECPPCRNTQKPLQDLLTAQKVKLRFAFRNLPLTTIHPRAEVAAEIGASARRQGKFQRVHNQLFDSDLSETALSELRRKEKLGHVTTSDRQQVERDKLLAAQIGIHGTPSFVLCDPRGKVYLLPSLKSAEIFLR